jgi:hypothetical protein
MGEEKAVRHDCTIPKIDEAYVYRIEHVVALYHSVQGRGWSKAIVFWTVEVREVEKGGPYHLVIESPAGTGMYCVKKVFM